MKKVFFQVEGFFLVFLIFFFSCTFEPDEEVFTEIEKPSFSNLILDLNEVEEDSILLFQNSEFTFRLLGAKAEVIEILVDSTIIGTYDYYNSGETLTFHLYLEEFEEGYHDLTIRFVVKSNSGSLADKLGAEYYQVWKQWVLEVNKQKPIPPVIDSIYIEDGLLHITWPAPEKRNFSTYYLTRIYKETYEYLQIPNSTTHFIDSGYVGDVYGYQLIAISDNHRIEGPVKKLTLADSINFTAVLEDGQVSFDFNYPAAYANVDEIRILELKEPYQYDGEVIWSGLTLDEDFKIERSPLFGEIVWYRLEIQADFESGNHKGMMVARQSQIHIGKRIPAFNNYQIERINPNDSYILTSSVSPYDSMEIFQLSWNHEILNTGKIPISDRYSITGHFTIAQNGLYSYHFDRHERKLYTISESFEKILYPLEIMHNFVVVTQVANNNVIMLNGRGCLIIDLNKNEELVSGSLYSSISPSGEYFQVGNDFFEYKSRQLIKLGEVERPKEHAYSVFLNDSTVILQESEYYSIRYCKDYSIQATVPLSSYKLYSNSLVPNTNEFDNYLINQKEGIVQKIDVFTGEVVNEIDVAILDHEEYLYANGFLFCQNGLVIEL